MTNLRLREHRFLGATQSLCPECLDVVPAKILAREGRVYFRKHCPTHGTRDDFVCADERWFDRMEYSLPGRVPPRFALEPDRGCPYDCGLCTEHEQHTCVAVLEVTSSCNLKCPLCYAASGPGGFHVPLPDCRKAIDHLVAYEGRPEILQLSGGEPTVHPDFSDIFEYACSQPIDIVMINTNGIRIAKDPRLRDLLSRYRQRSEVYLQFDGFDDGIYQKLRGEALLETKLRAIELLSESGVNVTLVCTVDQNNLDQVGRLVQFGMERPTITGVSFQPATYTGRYVAPESLEQRVTFPDVIAAIAEQTDGRWEARDFLPLPCAHPNAHSLAYAYREGSQSISLARLIDVENHLDLLANGITFNRQSARELISTFLSRQACGTGQDCGCGPRSFTADAPVTQVPMHPLDRTAGTSQVVDVSNAGAGAEADVGTATVDPRQDPLAASFFRRAVNEDLSPADMFRITTTSFMDAYNFDIRQLMKSCVHHLLPSGHLIPFCAYNVLYREGHVPLPSLANMVETYSIDSPNGKVETG
jgi:uncharacterized radical SAM superfamily Fe-S cluster-containing enzyme